MCSPRQLWRALDFNETYPIRITKIGTHYQIKRLFDAYNIAYTLQQDGCIYVIVVASVHKMIKLVGGAFAEFMLNYRLDRENMTAWLAANSRLDWYDNLLFAARTYILVCFVRGRDHYIAEYELSRWPVVCVRILECHAVVAHKIETSNCMAAALLLRYFTEHPDYAVDGGCVRRNSSRARNVADYVHLLAAECLFCGGYAPRPKSKGPWAWGSPIQLT